MTSVSTSVCVNYTPKEMYDLINDVKAYPRYIPLCKEVTLLAQSSRMLRAQIVMAKGQIKLAFTTENTLEEGQSIRMRLVEGPFKRLNAVWRFEPSGVGGCETSFEMDFEFANALLSMAFSSFFKEASDTMVEAFCKEAVHKYGERR